MMTRPPSPTINRVTGCPPWLPATLFARLPKGTPVRFRFSDAERTVLRRRRPVRVSQWAERHRVVRMSSLPGMWRNIFTPYLVGIMDAARTSGVEVVILCKTPQTGGSEAALNILGYMIDREPGPAMVVLPDELTAKENARDRLIPMIEDSRRLRSYLSGASDETSSIRINLQHMPVYLGWSGSVARLGNKPIRILILDELDKYQNPRKEATSESLAEKRTITWKAKRFIFKLSTPTVENGPIWTAFTQEAHARFDYQVVCPHCGTAQVMEFDRIRWPDDQRDPETVQAGRLAWYQCRGCDHHWQDADRDRAVRAGYWVERSSGMELFAFLAARHPSKIGFHLPAWLSAFVSLSEVAAAFLKWKKSGRLDDLKNFMNQYKAEPWAEIRASRDEDAILALCDDRPRGIVPAPRDGRPRVAALVAGVDTQASYFRYVIRAFGYGATEESWLVACGSAPNFEALDRILWHSTYTDADGTAYPVRACVIDAMGAPGRTKQVYGWCARHGARAMPYKGERAMASPVTYSPQDFFPDARGSKVRIPGGVLLRRVDTTFFKGDLSEKLAIAAGDPGTFWLHSNSVSRSGSGDSTGILAEYAREMCAEVFNPETLAWENPHHRANHFWDCEVMALVAAWELGIRNWIPPKPDTGKAATNAPTHHRPTPHPQLRGSVRTTAAERLARLHKGG